MSATSLSGRVALVTGASRGIGRAIALRFAAHGAALVLVSSARSEAALREVCASIAAAGGRALPLAADLADETARSGLVARAAAELGTVDILVNNAAGISAYAPPSRIDLAARRTMFELNFQAPVDLIQQALPGMRERRWGRILNIGSGGCRTVSLPMLRMRPQRRSRMPGSACWIRSTGAWKFSSNMVRRAARSILLGGA